MNFKRKIFINKDPKKEELQAIRKILKKINVKERLKDSFIYVKISEEEGVEVLTFMDTYVFLASKELNVNNKMAIEYLIRKEEIDQNVNSVLYWSGINDIKKYVPVLSEEMKKGVLQKEYANINVYAKSVTEALWKMPELSDLYYLYLEDVDE
jgi:hypothetical protein